MLSARNIAALGFMTFATYLGAGNLIFPPFLGYQAGEHFLSGMYGFLLTSVGLPALALVIIAIINGSDKLTVALPKPLANCFWVMVFIVIGPAFAIPRTITVAYQFSFAPIFGDTFLIPFAIVFCAITILFALYPGKLIDNLGKFLTPILIAILVTMAITVFMNPSDEVTTATGSYVSMPFAEGLIQGYMTMDALGSICFGWIIFRAIRSMGIESPKGIAHYTIIAAVMYTFAMSFVYVSLSYIGSTSSHLGSEFSNGGDILTAFSSYHFGAFGAILLGSVMVLACLTTAIGITTAGSEFYDNTFRSVTYKKSVIITMLLSGLVANIGLDQLLAITLPAVVALHPVAIALLIIAPIRNKISQKMVILTTFIALVFGCVDAVHILDYMPADLNQWFESSMPLYSYFACWIVPTLLMIALGILAPTKQPQITLSDNKAA